MRRKCFVIKRYESAEGRARGVLTLQANGIEEDLDYPPRSNGAQWSTPKPSGTRSTHMTPNMSRQSLRQRSSAGPASLAPLDLPIHTSASEIFSQMPPPPLTRHTTYSSLPPSPRLEAEKQFDIAARGLGIREMEHVLERLTAKAVADNAEEDELFFPARSRRNTLDRGEENGRERDVRSPSPELLPSEGEGAGLSLWELLKDESGDEWEGWVVEGKSERIANFLAIPLAVEKVTLFGALLCLDGFLYNFTILPIRATFATVRITHAFIRGRKFLPISPTYLYSILRMLLLFIPTLVLVLATDASKMYHSVRGQDTIKLYVIFNALEIADRLCCAFGQDVLDTLFARETLSPSSRKVGRGRRRQRARPYFFFALSLAYVWAHTLIYFYMLVSLNVAINSYDFTLLSLLISNQFVEIKGSVFKKFEKENLFQILCADIVERFQLSLMLCVIAIRNMIEMAGSDIAFLPKSFMKGKGLFDSIASVGRLAAPVLFVIISEMLVDWLKHAFITKFNHVRASVYGRYTDVLAKDVMLAGSFEAPRQSKERRHPLLLDQSPLVVRRLGFASIPLACLVIRIGVQALGMLASSSHHTDDAMSLTRGGWAWSALKWTGGIGVGLCAWGWGELSLTRLHSLVALKVLLGLSLLSYSALRQAGMEEREAEDAVNDFGRPAVGESKEETEYNKQTTEYLSQEADDLPEYTSPVSPRSPTVVKVAAAGKKGKKWKLEEVERWSMVKRIW
ncbi:hypothetical protein JCM24511_00582 [Saitozyma sp. JCM 24511]|nr:hypothetical protein JCM24511_00582 [Saitozyma sp. JCM 24511]